MGMEKRVENEVTVKNTDQDVSVEINQLHSTYATQHLQSVFDQFNV